MSNYRKTMSQALQEMYPINEDNIDLMRKAAGGAAQTVKMKDGKLKMDMFTASAIMQILDKVNPANKKKMTDMINKGTKDGMMKLQDFAMKQVKSENDPAIEEEVDLDEADDFKPHMMYDPKTGKGYKADTMDGHLRMKKMGYTHDAPKTEEVDLDEAKKKPVSQMTPKEKEADAARRKEYKTYQKSKRNEELGEKFTKKDFRDNEDSNHHTENGVEIVNMYGTPAEKKLMAQIAKNHDKNREISQKEQKLRDAMVKKYYSKLESVELGEKYDLYHKDFSDAMQHAYDYAKSKMGITVDPKEIDNKVATGPKKPSEGKTNTYKLKGKGGNLQIQVYNKGGSKPFELNMYKEENALIPESNDLISQTVNLITYTQMQEKQDSADVDDDASQKDVDDAAKNIIMQLRKSVSMRGDKEVEFAAIGHGYKKKVDMKIAQKALDMYNKMKPQDKTKFQTTIAKSYKDLLNAIKGK